MNAITITNQTRRKINVRRLKAMLAKVLKLLGVARAEWTIALVNDKAMAELHARTMNNPTTTDVLTFDLRDAREIRKTREGVPVELDTVLCVEEAARRAKELRHSVDEELLLYAIHSLLHVQGYDDLVPKAAARMHRREDALLIALGIGPVYAAEEHEHARIPT
jgi:probable rRNA maturation factor